MKSFKQYLNENTSGGVESAKQLIQSALGIKVNFNKNMASIASKPPRGWKQKILKVVDKTSNLTLNYMEGDYISITDTSSCLLYTSPSPRD